MTGKFIVIEGCDLAGKDTQIELLKERIQASHPGKEVVKISFPNYGSFTGNFIKDWLYEKVAVVSGTGALFSSKTYNALLFQCAQICDKYAVADNIIEWLKKGAYVIAGRWWMSGMVYGTDDGLDPSWVEKTCGCLPQPDANILLDVNPRAVQHRMNSRGSTADQYERDLEKQVRVAEAYRQLWFKNPLWKRVDASQEITKVSDDIVIHLRRSCLL